MRPILLILSLLLLKAHGESTKFRVLREWKFINFTWPSENSYVTATTQGHYVPENNIISGIKYHDGFFYLTLPRMKPGAPVTLARIPAGPTKDTAPLLEPYPSWGSNTLDNCTSLQNVQNVEIDAKGQIWIIDGGRVETLNSPPRIKCQPKLVVLEIATNRTVIEYPFPEEVAAKNGSFLYDLVVDDAGYAYITDNSASDPGIIVFSVKETRAWKVRNPKTMAADASATSFHVNNAAITAPINIAGIALGPKVHTSNSSVVINDAREVFFAPMSSLHLYAINTTILRNERLSSAPQTIDEAIRDVGVKSSQSVSMVMDNQGVLYYSLLGDDAIGRWDSHISFQSGQTLIARDPKYIEWPNAFTFDQSGNLTVVVNRLNRFISTGGVDINEANFRLIGANVGGRSYLYDSFNYETEHSSTEGTSTERSTTGETRSSTETPRSSTERTEASTEHVKATPSSADGAGNLVVPYILGAVFFLF